MKSLIVKHGLRIKVAAKADTLYYVGDNTSYKNPQIAKATATILDKIGVEFKLDSEEEPTE